MKPKDRASALRFWALPIGMALVAGSVSPAGAGPEEISPANAAVQPAPVPPPPPPLPPPTPQDLREEIARRGPESGLTGGEIESILHRADRLEAAGLPSRPVLDRVLQGLAKGIPFERIEAAVDHLEVRLIDAGRRVDAVFGSRPLGARSGRLPLIDHSAYALSAGASGDALEEIMSLSRDEGQGYPEAAAAILALGSLASCGMDSGESVEFVRTAWTSGYRGFELERLGRDVASLGRPGQGPPRELIDDLLGRMRTGVDRERLFRDLELMRGPGPRGSMPPGMGPGEDPGHMRGPGGRPDQPGRQGPGGHHPPPRRADPPPSDPPGRG